MGSSSRIFQALADAVVSAASPWRARGAAVLTRDDARTARVRAVSGGPIPGAIERFAGSLDPELRATLDGLGTSASAVAIGDDDGVRGAIVVLFPPDVSPPDGDLSAVVGSLWTLARPQLVAEEAPRPKAGARTPIGRMASGVAHDLKNVLNPLALQVQLLTRSLKRARVDEAFARDAGEALEEMGAILKRGTATLDALHELGRPSFDTSWGELDLTEITREAIRRARLAAEASPDARTVLVRESHGAVPRVAGRSSELAGALEILVARALRVTPRGGEITVASTSEDGACIRVVDQGPALDPELHDHVFEPFALPVAEDPTGIGLARVHACARRHGGRVTFEAIDGGGAEIALWLPVLPSTSSGSASGAP